MNAVVPPGAGLLRRWLWSAGLWTVVAGLVVLLDIAWHLPQQMANFRAGQLAVELAVEIFLALTFAALAAALQTAAWVLAGGLGTPPTRASHVVEMLAVALAVFCLAGVVLIADFQWLALAGLPPAGWLKMLLAIAVFAAAGFFLAREWRMRGGPDVIARRLASPSRRVFLLAWPVSLAVALWGGVRWRGLDRFPQTSGTATAGKARPNILLVTFDTLAAADMSLHGYRLPTTPHIDRWAQSAIVFDRYYAAAAFTSSAVTSMLTGQNVLRHGWYQALSGRLPKEKQHESLAAVLQADGYVTGAIVANVAAHPMHLGLESGFDVLPSVALPNVWGSDFAYHLTNTGVGRTVEEGIGSRLMAWANGAGMSRAPAVPYAPDLAFAQAERFLSKVREPFFLWVHLVPPHFPYDAPPPYSGRFLPGAEYRDARAYAGTALGDVQGAYDPALQPEMEKVRLRYDEYIAYADNAFAGFMARAEKLIGDRRTVTILSSDHGENFNHGYWGHGETTLWNNAIHIPLAIRLPEGEAAGRRVSGVAGQVDLLPTVLDLAGIAAPSWAEGRSLRPMWEGTETAGRIRLAINVLGGLNRPVRRGAIALILGNEKYLFDIETGRGALYDLENDAEERRDLSRERPQRAGDMRQMILETLARARRDAAA